MTPAPQPANFRADINALRALAVIAVTLYHFGLSGFAGGFAGVDIFFVISGYLMTGIIAGKMAGGTFGLLSFYAGRARRLLPALMLVCLCVLAAGWFCLGPSDYKQLGRHAATALTFVSNFIFKNESGYFDTLSQDKWLLHTWSLSVEWQFYLIYPLLLLGMARLNGGLTRARLAALLAVLTLGSFAFCLYITPRDPALAFFLLPARLWEMTLGGLVWALGAWRQAEREEGRAPCVMAIAGGAMMVATFVFVGKETQWSGLVVAPAALGCALVLAAARRTPAWLARGPVALLGLWSYSIYLWHWPVVVLMRQMGHEYVLLADLAGIALSVALGGLSYRFVETPLRRAVFDARRNRLRAASFGACFLLAAGGAWAVDRQDGMPGRADPRVVAIENDVERMETLKPQPCASDPFVHGPGPCVAAPAEPDYVIWGDSHASSVFRGVIAAAGEGRQGHTYQATCPPIPDAYLQSKKYSYTCPQFTHGALSRIAALPVTVPVIVVFRLAVFTDGYSESPLKPVGLTRIEPGSGDETPIAPDEFTGLFRDTLCRLAQTGRPVYVMHPVPEMKRDVARQIGREVMFKGRVDDVVLPRAVYRERTRKIGAALAAARDSCGIHLLDPAVHLCEGEVCYGSYKGQPLYTDDNHLNMHGAARLVPMFRDIFNGRSVKKLASSH